MGRVGLEPTEPEGTRFTVWPATSYGIPTRGVTRGNRPPLAEPQSAVLTVILNQRPYMENYLLDGRCALSNNAAENAIRPFTVGRKNWLFADSPKEANVSAAVYSII